MQEQEIFFILRSFLVGCGGCQWVPGFSSRDIVDRTWSWPITSLYAFVSCAGTISVHNYNPEAFMAYIHYIAFTFIYRPCTDCTTYVPYVMSKTCLQATEGTRYTYCSETSQQNASMLLILLRRDIPWLI